MSETPADKIDTTGAPEVTAMRPTLNKGTTSIVVEPAALAAEDDAEDAPAESADAPENVLLQDKVDDARAVATMMHDRLREAEDDRAAMYRRAVDLQMIGDDVAFCAHTAANTDMRGGRFWVIAVATLLLSALARVLGWDVVAAVLSLISWGLLGVMVGLTVQYIGARKRLLRRLAALRAELSGPVL